MSEGAESMTDLTKLTIAEARDRLRAGDFTARELTEACLSAVDAADDLNAVIEKTHSRSPR